MFTEESLGGYQMRFSRSEAWYQREEPCRTSRRRTCSAADLWNIGMFGSAASSYSEAISRALAGRWRTSLAEKRSSPGTPGRNSVWAQVSTASSALSPWSRPGNCVPMMKKAWLQVPSCCVCCSSPQVEGTAHSIANGNRQESPTGPLRLSRRNTRARLSVKSAFWCSAWSRAGVVSTGRPFLSAFVPGWRCCWSSPSV